jgi:hypothetical protein
MLRVDVRSKSAKIGLVYWIRGEEDRGKRGRGGKKDVDVIRDRGRRNAVLVSGSERGRDRKTVSVLVIRDRAWRNNPFKSFQPFNRFRSISCAQDRRSVQVV